MVMQTLIWLSQKITQLLKWFAVQDYEEAKQKGVQHAVEVADSAPRDRPSRYRSEGLQ